MTAAAAREAEALCGQAAALERQGRTAEAEAACRRAVGLAPRHARAHFELGMILRNRERWPQAEAALRQAVALAPRSAAAWFYLALTLGKQGRPDEAEAAVRQAVSLDPGNASLHLNHGKFLFGLGRFAESAAACERAVALNPGHADAHYTLALAHLICGDFERGWAHYGWRWKIDAGGPLGLRAFPQAQWRGEPLDGRRLLIWGEQGIGDEMIFFGLIPELTAQGIRCTIECHPRLAPLLARSLPAVEVAGRTQPPDPRCLAADLQVSAADLAALLRPRREGFAPVAPYLRPDAATVAEMRARYTDGGSLLTGISWWSGHPVSGAATSLPLDRWLPILRVPGVRFVSLQYGDRGDDIAEACRAAGIDILVDPSVDPLADMDRSAAQTAAMDLVITVDNATAATGATLGLPVWNMVSFIPAWGMGREPDRTPWHANLRLFRQPDAGDWDSVVTRVARRLAGLAGKSDGPPHG